MESYVIEDNPQLEIWQPLLQQCINAEGWSFNKDDYGIWKLGLNDFHLLVALEKSTGEAVASVTVGADTTAGPDGDTLYYIGTYYCLPVHRGKGLGTTLFDRAMQIASKGDNITLNAVPSMESVYREKYNFRFSHPHSVVYCVIPIKDLILPEMDQEKEIHIQDMNSSEMICEMTLEFDNFVSGRTRSSYLQAWTAAHFSYAKVYFKGDVAGFGCVRECMNNTLTVQPLYANSEEIAKVILTSILHSIKNIDSYDSFSLSFPSNNAAALSLAQSFSRSFLSPEPAVRTMFTSKIVPCHSSMTYAILDCGHSTI